MIRLLAVTGPTATGKTAAAVQVAHRLGSQIVSVDSRQVYRGLDLGTGKDLHEYEAVTPPVPYHLIDIADPLDVYTVFHYQRDCYRRLAKLAQSAPFADGTTPILLVGGSGLYLEAVLRQYRIHDVPEDPQLRAALGQLQRSELERRLRQEAPQLARTTDMSSRKRIVRALEIARARQRGPVRTSAGCPVPFEAKTVELTLPRDQLLRRIDARLEERLQAGMVDEVRNLLEQGVPATRLNQLGLEYREIARFLLGHVSFATMVEQLRTGIHRLAKRQTTYFRGLPGRGVPLQRLHTRATEELWELAATWSAAS